MKSPSYEKEIRTAIYQPPAIPVPFNVGLEGRFRISEAMAATLRSTTRPTSPRSSTGSSTDPVPIANDRVGAPLLETKMICDPIRIAFFALPQCRALRDGALLPADPEQRTGRLDRPLTPTGSTG